MVAAFNPYPWGTVMRGIEVALEGVVSKDPELKVSKGGTPYVGLNIAVVTGKGEDGDLTTWVRCTCFKEVAKEIAATAKKGSRLYCEGSLSLDAWQAADGEKRHGLSVMAWKAVVLGQIGRNRSKRAASGPDDTKPASNGGKHEKPFNDEMPF